MKHFLFFLGSGASVPFGLPTMKQMVDEFEDSLEKFSRIQGYFSILKNTLSDAYGYVDVELIFTIIDSISRNIRYADLGPAVLYKLRKLGVEFNYPASLPSEVEDAKNLSKMLREFVKRRCKFEDSEEIYDKINRLYGGLFDTICTKSNIESINEKTKTPFADPQCPIYTTNYDLIVESYFQGMSQINDLWKDENNMKVLDVDIAKEGMVELIKLHGSINWYKLEDGTIVNLETLRRIYGNQSIVGELMLYPIQQKDLYLYPWFNLFYRLKNDLTHTENWIVIGYSFNDEFIRNTFREIIADTRHKMLIIDPDAKHIVERYFGSNDMVVPITGKFEDDDIISKLIQHV